MYIVYSPMSNLDRYFTSALFTPSLHDGFPKSKIIFELMILLSGWSGGVTRPFQGISCLALGYQFAGTRGLVSWILASLPSGKAYY
jgi:hypothetical protein